MNTMNVFTEASDFVTAPEAARMISSSTNYINMLVRKGKLKPDRVLPTNHKRLFKRSDVEAYIQTMS